jgi:DNA repair protein RadC
MARSASIIPSSKTSNCYNKEVTKSERARLYQYAFDFGQKSPAVQAAEILRFTFTYEVKEDVQVSAPDVAGAYLLNRVFSPFDAFQQEEVWVLMLNTKNKITHQSMVYRGTINTAYIRIGELFRPALTVNAASIILSHLHPSGDPSPSPEDLTVTQQVYEAGNLLQVNVLDHIIVGRDRWVSLKTQKLMLP